MFMAIAVGRCAAIHSMYERSDVQSIEKSGSSGSAGAAMIPAKVNFGTVTPLRSVNRP